MGKQRPLNLADAWTGCDEADFGYFGANRVHRFRVLEVEHREGQSYLHYPEPETDGLQ